MANLQIIRKRFMESRKIYGLPDEITTPSGLRITGRYLLINAGACTPSHNPLNGFAKSEGFPTDDNGQTVNDRDYERDNDAQQITRNIAANYDCRALQSPVVVTIDGIVLSGNGRTMAGIIAARDNTDGAYINHLMQFPQKYGFTTEDVLSFTHPRVVFLTDNSYPYTAETFAAFNAQDIKSQSKTEQAVKLGKLVDDETFHRIIRSINTFDTIGEFYNNQRAATEAVKELVRVGVISVMQQPEMFDGDTISPQAREILENVLIGKAFQTNADAVREITAFKSIRKNIITALAEISNNVALTDYSLEVETAKAVELCYLARSNGNYAHGDKVSGFARQTTMFAETATIADCNDTTVLMLADAINHEKTTRLKRLFAVYNAHAKESANGQFDMFYGGVKTKEEILDEVKTILNYNTRQLEQKLSDITARRKHDARSQIFMEQAQQPTSPEPASTSVTVGQLYALNLPNSDSFIVKCEHIMGNQAGIRLKGWKRIIVPLSVLVPTAWTSLSLPTWWRNDFTSYNDIVTFLQKKDDNRLVA